MNQNKDIFIISTRYIFDKNENYNLFSTKNVDQQKFLVNNKNKKNYLRNYLFKSLLKYEEKKLKHWWISIDKKSRDTIIEKIKKRSDNSPKSQSIIKILNSVLVRNDHVLTLFSDDENLNVLFDEINNIDNFKTSPYILGCNNYEWDIDKRFTYCSLKPFSQEKERQVYIIPELLHNFEKEKENWIKPLIEQFSAPTDNVYIVLHDRDISLSTFKIIYYKEEDLYELDRVVTLAVYQHEDKDKIASLFKNDNYKTFESDLCKVLEDEFFYSKVGKLADSLYNTELINIEENKKYLSDLYSGVYEIIIKKSNKSPTTERELCPPEAFNGLTPSEKSAQLHILLEFFKFRY